MSFAFARHVVQRMGNLMCFSLQMASNAVGFFNVRSKVPLGAGVVSSH